MVVPSPPPLTEGNPALSKKNRSERVGSAVEPPELPAGAPGGKAAAAAAKQLDISLAYPLRRKAVADKAQQGQQPLASKGSSPAHKGAVAVEAGLLVGRQQQQQQPMGPTRSSSRLAAHKPL